MSQRRRTFSREFKLAAVKKVVEQGLSCREVARDLDVRDNLIRNWFLPFSLRLCACALKRFRCFQRKGAKTRRKKRGGSHTGPPSYLGRHAGSNRRSQAS